MFNLSKKDLDKTGNCVAMNGWSSETKDLDTAFRFCACRLKIGRFESARKPFHPASRCTVPQCFGWLLRIHILSLGLHSTRHPAFHSNVSDVSQKWWRNHQETPTICGSNNGSPRRFSHQPGPQTFRPGTLCTHFRYPDFGHGVLELKRIRSQATTPSRSASR